MTNEQRLSDVLSIFCERFHLNGPDDSAGCVAIQSAIMGKTSIAEVRRVLTEDYDLYPHLRGRALALLDACEVPASAEEAPLATAEPPAEEPIAEVPAPRRRRQVEPTTVKQEA